MVRLRSASRLFLFVFWTILLVPPQLVLLLGPKGQLRLYLPALWHRMICRAFGIKIEISGTPLKDSPALLVGNHLSYLDIPVLSAVTPLAFVAKRDVASWPVFGFFAVLQQTVFVSRTRATIRHEKNAIATALETGSKLVIFPEGTSTDGQTVIPFKPGLFEIFYNGALSTDIPIQPFTIEFVNIEGADGQNVHQRDLYAWYGEMTLPPHLATFSKLRQTTIRVHFHPPCAAKDFPGRKELASHCFEQVITPLAKNAQQSGIAERTHLV